MELLLAGQIFYWDKVTNNPNNDSVYNITECKYVKGDQDRPMHRNGKTYHRCRNHNDRNGMWVVHL